MRGLTSRRSVHRRLVLGAVCSSVLALALPGCALSDGGAQDKTVSTQTPSPSHSELPAAVAAPIGKITTIASDLRAPWSVVRGADFVLVSERDSARILELDGSTKRTVGTVPGVAPDGEGGLLGIAVRDIGGTRWLYAYLTAADDNRIVRMPLGGKPGSFAIGKPEPVLVGIPRSSNHNGGRIAFGPDGMLYATTGDASQSNLAQRPRSLAGKILRMTPVGFRPKDNPIADSLAYSIGHRNPQGIAWDDEGRLWAAEFGQNSWDELNLIRPGANYGWPVVEGKGGQDGFTDPMYQWPTSDSSPSGIAIVDDVVYMAGLGGERLWVISPLGIDKPDPGRADERTPASSSATASATPSDTPSSTERPSRKSSGSPTPNRAGSSPRAPSSTPTSSISAAPSGSAMITVPDRRVADYLVQKYGRLRDVVAGPKNTIWVLTNNTDGRGTPGPGDDKLLQVEVSPAR